MSTSKQPPLIQIAKGAGWAAFYALFLAGLFSLALILMTGGIGIVFIPAFTGVTVIAGSILGAILAALSVDWRGERLTLRDELEIDDSRTTGATDEEKMNILGRFNSTK